MADANVYCIRVICFDKDNTRHNMGIIVRSFVAIAFREFKKKKILDKSHGRIVYYSSGRHGGDGTIKLTVYVHNYIHIPAQDGTFRQTTIKYCNNISGIIRYYEHSLKITTCRKRSKIL